MVSGCALPALTDLLAAFHDRYPGISIALSEDTSSELAAALREGRCDLAIIGTAGGPEAGLETALLVDEPLVAVVAPGHSLAARSRLSLRALDGQPLICLPAGTGVRAALDAGCTAASFAPLIAFEASALPMVTQLAARGLGVAIVPASAAGPELRAMPVSGPALSSRLEFAWNPDVRGPAARTLIGHARSVAEGGHR